MGPNVSVSVRVLVMKGLSEEMHFAAGEAAAYYFFLKESRLTTSPGFSPAAGLPATGSGASLLLVSGAGVGTTTGPVAGLGAPSPSARNCSPNCTPGSKNAVSAAKGMCSGAGSFLKVKVTSK